MIITLSYLISRLIASPSTVESLSHHVLVIVHHHLVSAANMSEPADTQSPAAAVAEGSSIAEVPIAKSESAPQSVEEPQNALTKEFTEPEWAALKEFRVS